MCVLHKGNSKGPVHEEVTSGADAPPLPMCACVCWLCPLSCRGRGCILCALAVCAGCVCWLCVRERPGPELCPCPLDAPVALMWWAVPLMFRVLGLAFQSWGWAQKAAFYGFIPLVLYVGAKKSGFTSVHDFKKAIQLPLT